MSKTVLVLLGALVLTGCVSTKNIQADATGLRSGEYRTITVTSRESPSFSAMTAGKAGFGLLGAAAMISAGNTIVRENDVEDPAVYIGRELSAALSEKLTVQVNGNGGALAKSGDPKRLADMYPDSDLLLDVQTINWSFAYFPTDWNNYRVIYSAKLRLVDTRSKKLLAEGFCARVPDQTKDSPSRDQLLADKAARLKSELRIAADQCIPEFASKVLGITG